ncbi:MAG: hypothetical protein ACLUOI_12635 [Eisenbergiella sp.]
MLVQKNGERRTDGLTGTVAIEVTVRSPGPENDGSGARSRFESRTMAGVTGNIP